MVTGFEERTKCGFGRIFESFLAILTLLPLGNKTEAICLSLLGHVWIHVTFGNIKKSFRPALIPYPPNVKTKNHKKWKF